MLALGSRSAICGLWTCLSAKPWKTPLLEARHAVFGGGAVSKYHPQRGAWQGTGRNVGWTAFWRERRAGELLGEMDMQHGSRGVGHKVESNDTTSLSELGISRDESSRWQQPA